MREEDDLLSIEERIARIKEHKDKPAQNRNESAVMFISAFFVMLLLFLGIAKQISPDVDVSIGDATLPAEDYDESYKKSLIDDRLKLIQMEDENLSDKTGENIFEDSLEERVVLPENLKRKTVTSEGTVPNDPLPTFQAQKEALINSAAEKTTYRDETEAKQSEVTATSVNAKVIVGYYATPEQAQVAKGILVEAGLNINPFIKQIGNAYTIQTGSYSTMEKAKNAANELLQNNFPARIITEQ